MRDLFTASHEVRHLSKLSIKSSAHNGHDATVSPESLRLRVATVH